MDNVTFIKLAGFGGEEIEHAIIDHGKEQFTSMLKTDYDEMQAEELRNLEYQRKLKNAPDEANTL